MPFSPSENTSNAMRTGDEYLMCFCGGYCPSRTFLSLLLYIKHVKYIKEWPKMVIWIIW
jgi:hypothetical protein